MDSLAFLERANRAKVLPIYVLHGDEDFLKRAVLDALRTLVLGDGDDSLGLSSVPGDKAVWSAVHDELETLPFLSPRRLVVVEDADAFVTRHRSSLEKYFVKPSNCGVLVLDVKSWPASTKLAKLLDSAATLVCKAPAAHRLPEWCVQRAAGAHGKQLTAPAARLLVDLVGADMGQLDQELAKLTSYAGDAARIEVGDVDKLVGCSREESTWKIFDAIAAGRPGEALAILSRVLEQGEDPQRILGAFSYRLRRLAQAYRLTQQGRPLAQALADVGVYKGGEQELRHLGPRRAGRLYDWLVEIDLGFKGNSPMPPRTQLERLVVNLARKN